MAKLSNEIINFLNNEFFYVLYSNYDALEDTNNPEDEVEVISISFDKEGNYIGRSIKVPKKKQIDVNYIVEKINNDKIYTDFAQKFISILKNTEYEKSFNIYPTTYGIGVSLFMNSNKNNAIKVIEDILNKNEIEYSNEYSDAHYVYRFRIGKSKKNLEKLTSIKI